MMSSVRVNPFEPRLGQREIETMLASVDSTELAEQLRPAWQSEMENQALDQFDILAVGSPRWDLVNPLIATHLEQFATVRMGMIDEATRSRLRATLAEGVLAGEAVPDLARRIKAEMQGLQTWRATAIARTEVTRSANLARQAAWKVSSMQLMRQWVATRDKRVRASHLALDGEIRGMGEPWQFNALLEPHVGEDVMSPGDAPSAAHSINCRCTIVAFSADEFSPLRSQGGYDEARRDMLWRAFDRRTRRWESKTRGKIRPFYRQMTRDLLAMLPDE